MSGPGPLVQVRRPVNGLSDDVMPYRFRDAAEIEQSAARCQLGATMIRSAVHIDKLTVITKGIIEAIVKFFQAFQIIYFAKFKQVIMRGHSCHKSAYRERLSIGSRHTLSSKLR